MRYTEKEYDDGSFEGTNAIKTVIVKLIRAPSRLVGEVATKLPFFSKKNIESVLIAAMVFNLLDIVLNVVRLISLGRFNLFTGKNPIVLQIVAFIGLLGIYAWYEISDLSIYKTAENLLPKPEEEPEEPELKHEVEEAPLPPTPPVVEEEKEPKNSDSVPAPPKIINSSKQAVLSNLKEVAEDSDELDDSDDSEGDTQALIAPVSAAPVAPPPVVSTPVSPVSLPEGFKFNVPLDDPLQVIEQVTETQMKAEKMLEEIPEEEEKNYKDFLAELSDEQKEMLSFSEATKRRFKKSVMEVEDTFSSFSVDSFSGFECLAL